MSELINKNQAHEDFRRRLLASASVLVLLSVSPVVSANAADQDSDHPIIWIELGGQLEKGDSSHQPYVGPFFASPAPGFETFSPGSTQKSPDYSNGAEAKISFEPGDDGWVFSASLRYGRSNGRKVDHVERTPTPAVIILPGIHFTSKPIFDLFADSRSTERENHAIVDFQAGKDVGLGVFGQHGSSVLSAGIRYAQFTAKSDTSEGALFTPFAEYYFPQLHASILRPSFYEFHGTAQNARSFTGIGPSLSWDASLPFMGSAQAGEVDFDWGANAAILFGRQKATGQHGTTEFHYLYVQNQITRVLYHHVIPHARLRTTIVPNIGGFAGLSFRYSDAKISLGYRADFFFGAMDGGIDVAQKENQGFYGPFATISVGIGG